MADRLQDPIGFNKLKEAIKEHLDVDCSQYSDSFLARRFDIRLRATGIDDYSKYTDYLNTHNDEHNKLLKEMFIHVTNFFRDYDMWVYFKDQVIPKIVTNKIRKRERSIKIWSAGSSSGEEATSIAICLYEKLGEDLQGFNISIHGTDYDKATVERAKKRIYEESKFNEIPKEYVDKYFDLIDEKEMLYRFKEKYASILSFQSGDILNDPIPDKLDLIFCRNTVIYFDIKAKSKLYVNFFNALNDDGFFIMGKTEILQGIARDYFNIVDTRERVYDKKKK